MIHFVRRVIFCFLFLIVATPSMAQIPKWYTSFDNWISELSQAENHYRQSAEYYELLADERKGEARNEALKESAMYRRMLRETQAEMARARRLKAGR